MLKSLRLRNFTAFAEADLRFAPGLNLLVGENGTGKTHLLKVAYATLAACTRLPHRPAPNAPTKSFLAKALAEKLTRVFRPDSLGRLAKRQTGRNRAEVRARFRRKAHDVTFSFHSASKTEVSVAELPRVWVETQPVYLPPQELLTVMPEFVPMYETAHVPFNETWRDTCLLLGKPLAKGPHGQLHRKILRPLEEAMGGRIEADKSGRFYLKTPQGRLEANLVAEGVRKLGMLARLLANRGLGPAGCLFWDEPEANLNPKLVRVMAPALLGLVANGLQVFVATHSLFLMREVFILLQSAAYKQVSTRFFGLERVSGGVAVAQGDSYDDLAEIRSLQEQLDQSERYLAVEGG